MQKTLLKRPESVLVVVYTKDLEVLLLQKQDYPAFWQSVTGSLDVAEKPLLAAKRELLEETGLNLQDGELIDCQYSAWFDIYPRWQHKYPSGVTKNLEHVFVFKLPSKRQITISREHANFCWLPKQQAILKVISDTNKQAIERFVNTEKV